MRTIALRIKTGLVTVTGTGAGASAVLALLVIASVFVSVVMPRASLSYRSKALRQVIAATSALGGTIIGSIDLPTLGEALGSPDEPVVSNINSHQFAPIEAELARNLRVIRAPVTPRAAWWGATTGFLDAPGASRNAYSGALPPQVELIDRGDLGKYTRLIAGQMPVHGSISRNAAVFGVAVTQATAAKFKLHVGSRIGATDSAPDAVTKVTLVVTGILRPVRLGSAFWTADPSALHPTLNPGRARDQEIWVGGMFVGDSELNDIEIALTYQQIRVTWVFPLNLAGLNANQASPLNAVLTQDLGHAGVLTTSVPNPVTITLQSAFAGPLTAFLQTATELGSLLALAYVSLTVVAVVVLLLGARLLAERRALEFGLIRARGAARIQLALLAARAGAVVVLPAAAAGALLGVAVTPGDGEPLGWWLAAITAAVALAGVPWMALRRVSGIRVLDDRADAAVPRKVRLRRIVIDIAAALAAIGGLTVLRLQLTTVGATDWYTSTAPVLVAIPMAIVVVRAYPVVLRWLVGLLGRRRSVTTFVGLARATRTSITAVLPALALVLALAVIAFGAMLRTAVVSGDVAQSWREVGADAVVDASGSNVPLNEATERALAAVPGVRRAAVLSVTSGTAADGTAFGVIVVTPEQYAALVAQTPAPAFPARALAEPAGYTAGAPLPALASPGTSTALASGPKVLIGITPVRVHVVGSIASVAGVPQSGPFIVVPAWAADRAMGADRPMPNVMLLVGPLNHADVFAAVSERLRGTTNVTFRSDVLSALTGAALPHGAYETFALAAVAAAGFGAVIMLIMLALGARPRELTLARLFTMGLSRQQARRLVIAEALPVILAATAGGAICAWALVPLVGPSIDLSPFTGTTAHVAVRANFAVIGYLAAGLVALALITLFAQAALTRLRGVSRALRVGE